MAEKQRQASSEATHARRRVRVVTRAMLATGCRARTAGAEELGASFSVGVQKQPHNRIELKLRTKYDIASSLVLPSLMSMNC
jgi:hypothetical protein